jgi:hypothetical protein
MGRRAFGAISVTETGTHCQQIYIIIYISRDSSVGIVTGYGLEDRGVGFRVPVGSRIFFTSSRPAVGSIQPPVQLIPAVKRPGREAEHSPQAVAEVKIMWIYTSTYANNDTNTNARKQF